MATGERRVTLAAFVATMAVVFATMGWTLWGLSELRVDASIVAKKVGLHRVCKWSSSLSVTAFGSMPTVTAQLEIISMEHQTMKCEREDVAAVKTEVSGSRATFFSRRGCLDNLSRHGPLPLWLCSLRH
jgi:hypothetical protein